MKLIRLLLMKNIKTLESKVSENIFENKIDLILRLQKVKNFKSKESIFWK